MPKSLRYLLLLLICIFPVRGYGEVFETAGLAEPLESVDVSARAVALGSSLTGLPGSLDSLGYNPAGLSGIRNFEVALHHNEWLSSIRQETFEVGGPLKGLGVAALSFHTLQYGALYRRDANGTPDGVINPRRLGLTAALGRGFGKRLSLGLAVHATDHALDSGSYRALTADFGTQYRLRKSVTLGASIVRWGTPQKGFHPARSVRVGFSNLFTLDETTTLLGLLSAAVEPEGFNSIHAGMEAAFLRAFQLRAGGRLLTKDNPNTERLLWSVGMGCVFKKAGFNYAYSPQGDLGQTHRISLELALSSPKAAPAPTSTAASKVSAYQAPQASGIPGTLGNPMSSQAPESLSKTATPSGDNLNLFFSVPQAQRPASAAIPPEILKNIDTYQTFLEKNPSRADAWMVLGKLYIQAKQREEAAQCFEQVLRLRPDFKELQDWLNRYKALSPTTE